MNVGREIRDPEQVAGWLSTGLCLMRLDRPGPRSLERCIPWVQAAISEAPALPPVGVIADMGALLERGGLDVEGAMPLTEPRLRAAVRGYEDALLGRLAADPRFEAASDALARLPADRRPEGVAVLVFQLLRHMLFSEATAVSPAAARRVLSRPTGEILSLGLAGLRSGPGADDLQAGLAPAYEQLVHRARHTDALLTDKDVFTLENLAVLRSMSRRVAIHQVVDAAEVLERALPRRLRRRTGRRGGTPTRIEDESAYPAGGFAAITNSGPLENIVCSELVYMDGGDRFDLFDVRFAEDELLFFSRDDSVFLRNQRWITFLLHADLMRARFKDAELPWQRLVLVLGLLLCVVRRIHEWLGDEALLLRFVFLDDDLADEQELLGLLLREWVERGTVQVSRGEPGQALSGGEAAVVLVACREEAAVALQGPRRRVDPHVVFLGVGQPCPVVHAVGQAPDPERRAAPALDGWIAAARALLEELL